MESTSTIGKTLFGAGLAVALGLTIAAGNPALAQTWTELSPTGGPPSVRHEATAVLDAANNRMIVFGGQVAPGVCTTDPPTDDVWVLENADGTGGTPTWTQLLPTGAPPAARAEHTAVYDANSNRMIVFGGTNPGISDFDDLWVLTNANGLGGDPEWILLTPLPDTTTFTVPDARRGHAAVYDSANNRMILAQGPVQSDLWVLTNANGLGGTPQWTELFATGNPPPSGPIFHAGYDPATNRMMILNTTSGQLRVLENANGLAGTPNWVARSPSGDVPGTTPFSINVDFSRGAYDPSADRYFMFGRFDGFDKTPINDTFILEDATSLTVTPTWTLLSPSGVLPPNRHDSSVVLNAAGNRMIAFAGRDFTGSCPGVVYNDVWVLALPRKILVAPLSHDFGEIDAFTTQDAIVTISNTGGADLEVTGVAVTAGDTLFSITDSDPLDALPAPFTLSPGDDVFVTVTFFPTSLGLHVGTLTIDSDDPDDPIVDVSLIGNGLAGAVYEAKTALEDAVEEAIDNENLVGSGSGNSADGRVGAFANMIEAAGDLIEAGFIEDACGQLRSALRRVDGDPRPPDFVVGDGAALIEEQIELLRDSLGCS